MTATLKLINVVVQEEWQISMSYNEDANKDDAKTHESSGMRHEAEVMKSKVVDKIKTATGLADKHEDDQAAWKTK